MKRVAWLLALVTAVAHADDDGAVSGFEATGSGPLNGRAVDAGGKPLKRVEIHVVSKAGEQIVRTDDDGKYTVQLTGAADETSMIFVRGHKGAHLGGIVTDSTVVAGEEAIEMHETKAPATAAKPVDQWIPILSYSLRAVLDAEWTRAWMTLDLDARGHVRQLKWIRRPGHGLDPIAVRRAFATAFEPARDSAKRPVASQLVWVFEWPTYWWLIEHEHYDLTHMPSNYTSVACQKPGEHHAERRDCAQPDLVSSLGEAWIAKPY